MIRLKYSYFTSLLPLTFVLNDIEERGTSFSVPSWLQIFRESSSSTIYSPPLLQYFLNDPNFEILFPISGPAVYIGPRFSFYLIQWWPNYEFFSISTDSGVLNLFLRVLEVPFCDVYTLLQTLEISVYLTILEANWQTSCDRDVTNV